MIKKVKFIGGIFVVFVWITLALFAWFLPSKDISEAERRKLEQFPKITAESIVDGKFASQFENYTLDQFPLRDTFRQIKSVFHYYVLNQKDNNDIYVHDGYAAKMEYPLNENSIKNAVEKLEKVYNKYIKGTNTNVYISVIPDKGYYLADRGEYLKMDYSTMFKSMSEFKWAKYIDLTDTLNIESYYRTDTHWRQENILPVAQRLCEAMGADIPKEDKFIKELVKKPFYGVYCGQAALPMKAEDLYVMINEDINTATVFDYEKNKEISIYDKRAINSKDLYDTYLYGAKALLEIRNPNAESNKELIIFRDSFGSSIAPLLVQSYSKITLIDIRYIPIDYIGNFIEFNNQDILFLYSTSILNSSFSFK